MALTTVFVAACTGTCRLAQATGLPVALVAAADDADAAIEALNGSAHASGRLWPGSFQPFDFEDGWTDWRMQPLLSAGDDCDPSTPQVSVRNGRLLLSARHFSEFDALGPRLAFALRDLALEEVTKRPDWLLARSDALADYACEPRYTADLPLDIRSCRRARDLYALDPLVDVTLLRRRVSAALSLASADFLRLEGEAQ